MDNYQDQLTVLFKDLTPFILDSPQLNQMFEYYGTFDKVFPLMCGYLPLTIKNLQPILEDLKKAHKIEYYLDNNDQQQLKILENKLNKLAYFIQQLEQIIHHLHQSEMQQNLINDEKIKSINHLMEFIHHLKLKSSADEDSKDYALMAIYMLDKNLNEIKRKYKNTQNDILNEMVMTTYNTISLIEELCGKENPLIKDIKTILNNNVNLTKKSADISKYNIKRIELLNLIDKILAHKDFWEEKLKNHSIVIQISEPDTLLTIINNNTLAIEKKYAEVYKVAVAFLKKANPKDPDFQHLFEAIIFADFEKLHDLDHRAQAYKYIYLTKMLDLPLYLTVPHLLHQLTTDADALKKMSFINNYIVNLIIHFEIYIRDVQVNPGEVTNEKKEIAQHSIHLLMNLIKSDDTVKLRALKIYQYLIQAYQKNMAIFTQKNADDLDTILQSAIEFMEKYYVEYCNEKVKSNYYSYHFEK